MSHAFKKVAPLTRRISFVAAVQQFGDMWPLGMPLLRVGLEEKTQDWREGLHMIDMERGVRARVTE